MCFRFRSRLRFLFISSAHLVIRCSSQHLGSVCRYRWLPPLRVTRPLDCTYKVMYDTHSKYILSRCRSSPFMTMSASRHSQCQFRWHCNCDNHPGRDAVLLRLVSRFQRCDRSFTALFYQGTRRSCCCALLDPTAPRRLLRLRTVIERCSGQNVNVVMVRTDRNSMVPTMQVAERSI